MAHVQVTGQQHLLHGIGQLQQTQQVAGRAAAAAHGLGRLFVGELEFLHQALQALGFFQRVQVFALDVLDQGHHRSGLVGHGLDQHRHLVQPGQPGGAEAAFASDDLVAPAVNRPHQDGLHHALALDALGQFVQRTLVHARARLVLAGLQAVQPQSVRGLVGAGRFRDLGAEQGLEAQPQALGFFGCHAPDCQPARRRLVHPGRRRRVAARAPRAARVRAALAGSGTSLPVVGVVLASCTSLSAIH